MALAHINSDPATRAELSRLADQAGVPRAQFLRVLTRRYGPALVRDLTQPARGYLRDVVVNPRANIPARVATDFGLPGDGDSSWSPCAWPGCPNVVSEEGCICPQHGIRRNE